MIRLIFMLASVAILSGCGATVAENAVNLDVAYKWSKEDQCSRTSPEISLGNIPSNTKELKVKLKDLDAPSWDHGGGKVAYMGQTSIQKGELKSGYNGPCPPSGSHTYVISVDAIDSEGVIVGRGKAKDNCCMF